MLQVRSPYWVLPAHPTCWKLGDAWLSLVRSEFVQRDSTQTAGRNSVLWHLTVDQRGTRTGHPGLWYFAFQFNGLWNLQKRFRGFNLFQGLARVTKRRCCTSHLSRKSGIKCYCCCCSRSSERWCVRKLKHWLRQPQPQPQPQPQQQQQQQQQHHHHHNNNNTTTTTTTTTTTIRALAVGKSRFLH